MATFDEITKSEIESRFKACTIKNVYLTNEIPYEKLSKAKAAFAEPSFRPSETPLLLVDSTIFGSCKSGILITNEGIYTGDQSNKARAHWLEIESAESSGLRLKLNGQQFGKIDLERDIVSLVVQAINAITQIVPHVVFPADYALLAPNCCVGCFSDDPGFLLLIPAIRSQKGKNLVSAAAGKTALIGLGLALGPILGSAVYSLPSLFKGSGMDFYYFPVCRSCKTKGSIEAFLATDGKSTVARFRNAQYGNALMSSLSNSIPENRRLMTIDPERRNEINSTWDRPLSELEAVIVNAWREIAPVMRNFISHPKITEKRLAAARASYWRSDQNAPVIAHYDATLFGSGKSGLLITTEGLYWRLGGASYALKFRDISLEPQEESDAGGALKALGDHMGRDDFLRLRAFLRYVSAVNSITRKMKSDD